MRRAGDLEMTWSASPPRTYATPKFRELGVLSASREEEHHEAHREERERRRSGHGRDEALRPRCLYHRGGMDVIPEEKLVEGDLVRDRIDAVEIGREIGLETRIGRVGDPEAGGVGRDILREIEKVELIEIEAGVEGQDVDERRMLPLPRARYPELRTWRLLNQQPGIGDLNSEEGSKP